MVAGGGAGRRGWGFPEGRYLPKGGACPHQLLTAGSQVLPGDTVLQLRGRCPLSKYRDQENFSSLLSLWGKEKEVFPLPLRRPHPRPPENADATQRRWLSSPAMRVSDVEDGTTGWRLAVAERGHMGSQGLLVRRVLPSGRLPGTYLCQEASLCGRTSLSGGLDLMQFLASSIGQQSEPGRVECDLLKGTSVEYLTG